MINLDKFTYQELARRIEILHDTGYSWSDAQIFAIADMWGRYGWKP